MGCWIGGSAPSGTARDLREQLNDQYTGRGTWFWCEGIRQNTGSPVDRELVALQEDFVGDLARMAGKLRDSGDAVTELRSLLQPLYSHARFGEFLRDTLPSDDEMRGLLAAAEDECLAALVEEDEGS